MTGIERFIVSAAMRDQKPIEALLGLFFLSFVAHWPEKIPTSIQELWTWLRATFQTALPINRVSANPQPPAEPAQK